MRLPIARQITYQDPDTVFALFSQEQGALFFDSAQQRPHCGRYSFIAIDPFLTLTSKNGVIQKNNLKLTGNPFDILANELATFKQPTLPDLPPFQGGAAGYFGYELHQHLETIPMAAQDDMQFPDMLLGFYDLVISFDLIEKKAWVISTGFPILEPAARIEHAKRRLSNLLKKLSPPTITTTMIFLAKEKITSTFTQTTYQASVQCVIDYILAGDIFQANLSQRFQAPLPSRLSSYDLYKKLRTINPAPFSAYLNFPDTVIASASPERFIQLTDRHVETRPIKGTRPRGKTIDQDTLLAQELLTSQKDLAENVMIVDLLRNDLSRVCEAHSVNVSQLCGLETYASVHHLVSVVEGTLNRDLTAVDLLKATFPGGSITGAPKIRAMEIIAELEPTQRGPYCGSIGYIGFDGNMDSSITIRTFCINNHIVTFQVGGAIVADSDPVQEYEETLTKAHALMRALTESI